MDTSVKQRLKAFLKNQNLSQSRFEKATGLSNGYVNNIRKSIQPEKIESIARCYPQLNTGWLLTGEGEMLKSDTHKGNAKALDMSNINYMNVPIVPISAQAGMLTGYGDPVYIDSLDTMPVIVDKHYKGRYMIFEVAGDSMTIDATDCLLDGDKVLCRSVQMDYWKSKLYTHKWKYWVFVTRTEGIVIKKIKSQDTETGIVILQSLNPMYKDIKLHLNDVVEIYNVIRIVERKI